MTRQRFAKNGLILDAGRNPAIRGETGVQGHRSFLLFSYLSTSLGPIRYGVVMSGQNGRLGGRGLEHDGVSKSRERGRGRDISQYTSQFITNTGFASTGVCEKGLQGRKHDVTMTVLRDTVPSTNTHLPFVSSPLA